MFYDKFGKFAAIIPSNLLQPYILCPSFFWTPMTWMLYIFALSYRPLRLILFFQSISPLLLIISIDITYSSLISVICILLLRGLFVYCLILNSKLPFFPLSYFLSLCWDFLFFICFQSVHNYLLEHFYNSIFTVPT